MQKKDKIFYGWWIAFASAFLNCFVGGTFYYGFTLFFNPIRQTFGWSATVTSVAFILQRLEMGVLGPIVGFLVDKVGARILMVFGWSVAGIGFIVMSRIESLWGFYISFMIIASGVSFGAFICVNAVLANWFIKRRSRAMTIMSVGLGISGILVPLLAMCISQYGWRTSLFFVGIGAWVIGIPISLMMRFKPGPYGYLPDGEIKEETTESINASDPQSAYKNNEKGTGSEIVSLTVKEALKTRSFWFLCASYFFQHVGTSAVVVHIVPYLESVNVSTAIAAMAVTGITVFSLIGRLSFGYLGDYVKKRYLIAIALAFQTLGLFIFSLITADSLWLIVLFLLIYGPGYGGPIPVRMAMRADYFGTKHFGAIMGLSATISMVGGIISPVLAGWIFDTMGSYQLAWQLYALFTLPAIPIMILAKPPEANANFG